MTTKQLQFGKYVIVNGCPILFPLEITHNTVSIAATSAGFFILRIHSFDVEVYCWGESSSLNVHSNPVRDAAIIKDFVTSLSHANLMQSV